MKQRRFSRLEALLVATVVIGLTGVVATSSWIDSIRPRADSVVEEERLYLTASTVDSISLGFNGIAADWYWMRSLQYVGRKIIGMSENIQIDNLGDLDLKLLAPLLDATTTLDPQFMEPYQYAAAVLPAVDVDEAIRIIKKGIEANPTKWRLYHNLGYIYWKQQNYELAGEAYSKGATLPGAPAWMEAMKARVASEGGSRDTAREIYGRMYEESSDHNVKEMARRHLLQLDAWDELDVLRRVMTTYKSRVGRCPATWRDMESIFRALRVRTDSSGAPLDPAGTAYILVPDQCDATIDWKSDVPAR